ncbi:MAG: L-lactate dehydrogenase [Ruminococcus sp.]|nr:L-lactate dehydrogenase [Ruminococcus sp.]MDE7225491.1 L-lactate dehydrogenase [Ruminococcus sp.]
MANSKGGKKIAILGAGNVGATCAYTFAVAGTCSDIVLIDINKERAKGEAMDIRQGVSFSHNVEVIDGTYDDIAGADIVVVTLGLARKPGQSRIDLAQANVNIIKDVMPKIAKTAPDAIYVVVSNPVDIITYAILKCTDLKPNQVIGSGTALDTSRLRSSIADHLDISPNSVHAYVFGEHGDTSMIPWSITNIAGSSMEEYCTLQQSQGINPDEIIEEVRKAGGEVIKRKGATFYAIALTVNKICDDILRDSSNILTVSSLVSGRYGIDDVCLSLPCVIGGHGVEKEVSPTLTDAEMEKLHASADALKKVLSSLNFDKD